MLKFSFFNSQLTFNPHSLFSKGQMKNGKLMEIENCKLVNSLKGDVA